MDQKEVTPGGLKGGPFQLVSKGVHSR